MIARLFSMVVEGINRKANVGVSHSVRSAIVTSTSTKSHLGTQKFKYSKVLLAMTMTYTFAYAFCTGL